ncbi:zinc finger protein 341-like [Pollicipes pollicipes]|uniref:zinc finger protein 341-like n=1 Tax=Pollicipes pollicipes TaxID=41117 RepID=UPI0018855B55|nr:zinc finger protein 341-like [Pollicipes pollicipes]
MVFSHNTRPRPAMPGTQKMSSDSVCLVCCGTLKKAVPGNISVFEQQLSFTQRRAIDLLVEVLNTKESALTRSRWMCAHCYAQLELLDKYERDRRLLEQKAAAVQAELVGAHRKESGGDPAPDGDGVTGRRGMDDVVEELKNGNESDTSEYVEVKAEHMATSSLQDGSENGDDDDAGDAVCENETDQDPLADMIPVTEEVDSEPDDLNEDVPVKDPLADGDEQGSDGESSAPVVDVAALQNSLRTRLRSHLRSGSAPPPPPPLRLMAKRPASPPATDSSSPPPPPKMSISMVPTPRPGLKTLLPKPTPPAPAPTPVVTQAASAAGGQLPLLLQSVDGKLYMLPTGSQAAAAPASAVAAAASRGVTVRPDSQLFAPRAPGGPILESILQKRPGGEPCPLCSLIFGSRTEVDLHLRSHSMVCVGCDHLFASRVGLFEHRQACVPSRTCAGVAAPLPSPPAESSRASLLCGVCTAPASDVMALNEHAARLHSLLYRCPKCDCRTAELRQYESHVRVEHALDTPHPCNLCQTSFLKREQLLPAAPPRDEDELASGMIIVKEEEDVLL